ncbi:glycosyltransferase [Weissella oryzae SG25]|uniref:Glycosyltransferase n=1 Tax=Weissella oryzae (strain DSM 25784 / JCM 18191 / LMG 30913 / SG25) TaxID=1329250 RepID=A0A069CW38_WEIOS|nr:glycosyltransferase [Weissella oryzae]GAK31438.1 glycosyltransferase [Weissella oryzae SG25]
MNIGFFTDTYFPQVSGVATSIQTLRRQLEAQGHQVYIFTSTDPKVKKGTLEANIYRFSSLPFAGFKDRRIAFRGAIQALQLAKQFDLDIVHTQTEFSLGLMGKFVARQLKIPAVHTYHTNYQDYLHYIANGKIIRPSGVALMARGFMAGMTGVISPSKQTFDVLTEYRVESPIEVIPTGVKVRHPSSEDHSAALREKLDLDSDVPVVISIGRIAFEKNLEDALSAFAAVLEDIPSARFIIVGGGPAMSSLQEHVQALEIEAAVTFVGEVDHRDIYSYYRLGDVFLSASTSETQGLTFIEAITAKTPVVAIKSPYLETVVIDPAIGTLVDEPEELYEPLKAYLEAKLTDTPLGDENARKQVLHEIDERTFGERVLNFYHEAISIYHEEEDTDAADAKDEEYARSFLRNPFRKENHD